MDITKCIVEWRAYFLHSFSVTWVSVDKSGSGANIALKSFCKGNVDAENEIVSIYRTTMATSGQTTSTTNHST